MRKVVELHNLGMKYQSLNGEITALDEIEFDVYEGEFVSIVGPSGCGKSTLLSIICGLISPTAGRALVDGEVVTGTSQKIGYMLQKDHLFEWRTILQNVKLGLEIQKAMTPEAKAYTEHLLQTYGLYEFRNKYPNQLSGGMRQRAALIRTLVTNPQILLLDEAFSALDYQTRLAVNEDIHTIIKKENKTAIMVTHDIAESISMADRVVVLSKRPGTIKKVYEIHMNCEKRTPLKSRDMPEFQIYFQEIWKELDVHV
ncbi:MAG TPA: ABC transporter ATP-binding protein [Desulfitobacterium dehalogenans]|uniref:ABC transporter ATP-binding protein n=1 Tax=Desulfitobacterium dehalogenans TaxID=36854 RepID=A0A7C6Z5L1_9FIRM|nr:ABC transporter ATP-binding protein [Desulfitobacterium dehalogenans]